jgi:hypothetical protein
MTWEGKNSDNKKRQLAGVFHWQYQVLSRKA